MLGTVSQAHLLVLQLDALDILYLELLESVPRFCILVLDARILQGLECLLPDEPLVELVTLLNVRESPGAATGFGDQYRVVVGVEFRLPHQVSLEDVKC